MGWTWILSIFTYAGRSHGHRRLPAHVAQCSRRRFDSMCIFGWYVIRCDVMWCEDMMWRYDVMWGEAWRERLKMAPNELVAKVTWEQVAGSTARKRELCYSTHSGLGGALTQRIPWRTILPGCSPQLAASHLLNMPLPREVGLDNTAA